MKKLILLSIITFWFLANSYSQEYSWQKINTDTINGYFDFTDVFFTNENTGWITTFTAQGQNNIFKTTDGATSFSTQTTPLGETHAIHMLDVNNGYSGGQGGWVYKTNDGGLNWNMLATMGSLTDISFPFNTDTNNPVGYACGDNGRVWEITSTLTDLNSSSSSTFRGISAPSIDNVWVCGGNRIYYYNGTDFTSQSTPGGFFNDIHFINNMKGWVVGDGGVMGNTTNGGASWNTQTNPDTLNNSLYDVFFFDSDYGWAVGSDGLILHTTDGGTTWIIEAEGLTTEPLSGVHFSSPTNGYVVGNNKTLLKYGEVSGVGEETLAVAFELFPNPIEDKLQIICPDFKTDNGIIEIISLNGKVILAKNLSKGDENAEINVSRLESGMYFCKITIDKRSSTKKIIKE
jgi:hypothetical protein